MKNGFAAVHPELTGEWSEKNFPLRPEMVNEKSRRNVWRIVRCVDTNGEWSYYLA
jgi:hypothetical protein